MGILAVALVDICLESEMECSLEIFTVDQEKQNSPSHFKDILLYFKFVNWRIRFLTSRKGYDLCISKYSSN